MCRNPSAPQGWMRGSIGGMVEREGLMLLRNGWLRGMLLSAWAAGMDEGCYSVLHLVLWALAHECG